MNRKDMIIITVLLNIALLSALLALAMGDTESEKVPLAAANISNLGDKKESSEVVSSQKPPAHGTGSSIAYVHLGGEEELDTVLRDFQTSHPDIFAASVGSKSGLAAEQTVKNDLPNGQEAADYREVTVKRGDVLERIARANGTTVAAIKEANGLKGERLKVGQVLRIPIGNPQDNVAEGAKVASESTQESEDVYIVKNGDNLWKIAKQNQVRSEDLLKINGLDGEKAKNLRPGQRLRLR